MGSEVFRSNFINFNGQSHLKPYKTVNKAYTYFCVRPRVSRNMVNSRANPGEGGPSGCLRAPLLPLRSVQSRGEPRI